jgi:hypothetical protein
LPALSVVHFWPEAHALEGSPGATQPSKALPSTFTQMSGPTITLPYTVGTQAESRNNGAQSELWAQMQKPLSAAVPQLPLPVYAPESASNAGLQQGSDPLQSLGLTQVASQVGAVPSRPLTHVEFEGQQMVPADDPLCAQTRAAGQQALLMHESTVAQQAPPQRLPSQPPVVPPEPLPPVELLAPVAPPVSALVPLVVFVELLQPKRIATVARAATELNDIRETILS